MENINTLERAEVDTGPDGGGGMLVSIVVRWIFSSCNKLSLLDDI